MPYQNLRCPITAPFVPIAPRPYSALNASTGLTAAALRDGK
jgi:hypothetical protein